MRAVDHQLRRGLVVADRRAVTLVVVVVGDHPLIDELLLDASVFGVALDVAADHDRAQDHADDDQHHRHFDQGEATLARAAASDRACLHEFSPKRW